jgi:hypothetical protein
MEHIRTSLENIGVAAFNNETDGHEAAQKSLGRAALLADLHAAAREVHSLINELGDYNRGLTGENNLGGPITSAAVEGEETFKEAELGRSQDESVRYLGVKLDANAALGRNISHASERVAINTAELRGQCDGLLRITSELVSFNNFVIEHGTDVENNGVVMGKICMDTLANWGLGNDT